MQLSKTAFLFFGFFLIASICSAQNHKSTLLKKANSKDLKIQIDALTELAIEYTSIDADSALWYAKKGLQLAEEVKDFEAMSIILSHRAGTEIKKGQLDIAQETQKLALQVAEENQSSFAKSKAYLVEAKIHQNRTLPEEWEAALIKAEENFPDKTLSGEHACDILGARGALFLFHGQIDSASSKFQETFSLAKRLNLSDGILAVAKHNLMLIHFQNQDLDKALKAGLEARAYMPKPHKSYNAAAIEEMIAIIYGEMDLYNKALMHCQTGIEINEQYVKNNKLAIRFKLMQSNLWILQESKPFEFIFAQVKMIIDSAKANNMVYEEIMGYSYLGLAQMRADLPDEALTSFKTIFDWGNMNGVKEVKYIGLEGFTSVLIHEQFSGSITDLPPDMELLLIEGEKEAADRDIKSSVIVKTALTKWYELTNRPKLALEKNKEREALSLEIINAEKAEAFAKIQEEYGNKEKDQKIKIQEVELEGQNLKIIGIISFFSLLTLFIGLTISYRLRKRNEDKIYALKDQISADLHDDIGSTLVQINMLTNQLSFESDRPEIKEKTRLIRDKSKYVTSTMNDIVWSLDSTRNSPEDLISRLENHFGEVMKSAHIEFQFSVKNEPTIGSFSNDQKQQIFFIAKEAITNIIKHSDSTAASLEIQFQKEVFSLKVRNQYASMKESVSSTKRGIKNMQLRASTINGTLETQQEKDAFQVLLLVKI